MSIASEITRLQGCKANIRTALVNKGITSASTHNMADFATDISNISAGGATITVSYSSTFYNKTMTCSDGTTTYTKTTTSSGVTEFNVTDEGTWTITCDGISRTVNVVLNYALSMAIIKTVTLYSAAQDTVSFTDATGSKTCRTGNDGSVSVSITFIPPSQTITFTSSVAKNPDNLSAYYSKNINFTNSTSSVYVMPNNVLYWYGYTSSNLEDCTSANGWSGASVTPTHNTRDITLSGNSAISSKTKISITKGHVLGQVLSSRAYMETVPAKNFNIVSNYITMTNTSLGVSTLTSTETNYLAVFLEASNQSYRVDAFWYE